MNVLFFYINGFIKDELQECIQDMQGEAYFAATREEALAILNTQPMDLFFLEIKKFADTGLLKYVSENFKHIRVILTVESSIQNAISTIRSGHFDVLRSPFNLKQLRGILPDDNTYGETL